MVTLLNPEEHVAEPVVGTEDEEDDIVEEEDNEDEGEVVPWLEELVWLELVLVMVGLGLDKLELLELVLVTVGPEVVELIEPIELVVVVVGLELLELVVDVLVGDTLSAAVPPQTMFNETGRGVAYTVGLAPELAAEGA